MLKLPPLSLYIHIPWCERKCPYCDFNSHENKNDFDEAHYIQCLIDDFKSQLSTVQGRELQSIFIGGGTPSLFSIENINLLLNSIQSEVNFSTEIEITLEANPASSQQDYFRSLSQTAVNRVSLGVQSFQPDKLFELGRLHSSEEASLALEALSKNFDNFNIDLMFGLPHQTIDDSLFDIQNALKQSPPHLSWYQLTIEPNTVFYRDRPLLPNDDFICEMQEAGFLSLSNNNFKRYEISAFSQNNCQSKHNLNYWNFGDYLAIGAGAHGKISTIKNERLEIFRFQKTRSPKDYIKTNHNKIKKKLISKEDIPLEFFMNTFRLNKRVSLDLFYKRTGLLFSDIEVFCEKAESLNLILINDGFISKTELGEKHIDTLLGLF